MFLSEYIEFSFKLNDNDTIKKCLVITNYYDKNEIIIYELKRKIEFCLDRYTIDFCLPELDYKDLQICDYKFICKEEMKTTKMYNLFICCDNENFHDDYFIYNNDKIYFSRRNNNSIMKNPLIKQI